MQAFRSVNEEWGKSEEKPGPLSTPAGDKFLRFFESGCGRRKDLVRRDADESSEIKFDGTWRLQTIQSVCTGGSVLPVPRAPRCAGYLVVKLETESERFLISRPSIGGMECGLFGKAG